MCIRDRFNTLTYEAEPFAKLKVNGEDMELVENDIYAIKLTLKKNIDADFPSLTHASKAGR